MKRPLAILATLAVTATLTTVTAAPASASWLKGQCHMGQKFGPSMKAMKQFIYCETRQPARIVIVKPFACPKCARAQATTPAAKPEAQPGSGGPSCSWLVHDWSKVCYHHCTVGNGSCGDFVCFHWRVGYAYPRHCYAESAMSDPNHGVNLFGFAHSLWHFVKGAFKNHALRACVTWGPTPTGTAGVILKAAAGSTKAIGGPVGILAISGGGCLAGIMSYYFH